MKAQTHRKEVLFDAAHAKPSKPLSRPIEEQGERESQRLWEKTVNAIVTSNHAAATDEKTKIEDRQREEAAKRADDGVEWKPRLFRPVQGGPNGPDEGEEDLDWIINAHMYVSLSRSGYQPCQLILEKTSDPHDPQVAAKQIMAIAPIVPGQRESTHFQIPPHRCPSLANPEHSQDTGPAANIQA